MQSLTRRSALPAVFVLAGAVVLGMQDSRPAAGQEREPAPMPRRVARVDITAYEHTAIGLVLKANYGRVPASGIELVRALKKVGHFAQLPIPFSAVNTSSSLTTPRVIIAPHPGSKGIAEDDEDKPVPKEKDKGVRPPKGGVGGIGGLPGFPGFPGGGLGVGGMGVSPRPIAVGAISPAKVTEPTVEGRLFFAANMEKTTDGYKVKTIEFISWNSRKKRFDFGVIECGGTEPAELQILDGVRCFSCHKNKGPILSQGPWSNSTHNDVVRTAALHAFIPKNEKGIPVAPIPGFQPGAAGMPFLTEQHKELTTFDGISLVHPDPEACDAAVRQGGSLARDREIFRAMTKSPDGRKSLTILLSAIASPGKLDQNNAAVSHDVDLAYNVNFPNFASEFVLIQRTTPNMLVDFSPSGSMGTLRTTTTNEPAGWGGGSFQRTDTRLIWSGDTKMINDYNSKRAAGEPGMPSQRQPSNPRAFVRPNPDPPPPPAKPSTALNAMSLARMIGLTEGDRKFMGDALNKLSKAIDKPKVTPMTLAREIFTTPVFFEQLKANEIPDREEFKDLFVSALGTVAKHYKISEGTKPMREDYASGPSVALPPGQEEKEIAVVPTTACLRCHDVRGIGKPAFNPIPMLAFDPFDKQARETWMRNNDATKRTQVITRMLKRIVADKDMPPEDAPEYEKFRTKDAASFDALKDWLEAELKLAKGNG